MVRRFLMKVFNMQFDLFVTKEENATPEECSILGRLCRWDYDFDIRRKHIGVVVAFVK